MLARSDQHGTFTWGRADQNQLGREVESTEAGASECTPRRVPGLPLSIKQVSCGSSHGVACGGALGEVYSWGFGETYQLGHGNTRDEKLPKKVESVVGKKVLQVSSGSQHTCMLLE